MNDTNINNCTSSNQPNQFIQNNNQPTQTNHQLTQTNNPQIFNNNLFFVPPPINETQKYLEQLDQDLTFNSNSKNHFSIQSCIILGEQRSLHPQQVILPEPIFVNEQVKNNLKKMTKNLYLKMLQSFNVMSGKSTQKNYSMGKIQNCADQIFELCQKIKVGQTQVGVLKIMQEQTKQLKKKTQELQNCINDIQQELQARAFDQQYE